LLGPLQAAASAACRQSGLEADALATATIAGMDIVEDEAIAAGLCMSSDRLVRVARGQDLGYAAGLLSLDAILASAAPGFHLAVSAGGVGLDNAHAAIVEIR